MRLLFVSNDSRGGSSQSQRQLARRLVERGHEVEILAATVESRVVRPLYDHQVDLATKLRTSGPALTRLRPAVLAVQRRFGTRLTRVDTSDHPTWRCVVIENGFRALSRRFRPDVVVAASIDRVSWRRIRAQARAAGIPTVLYLREASGVGHLTITGAPPDLLLANAHTLAADARAAGYECEVVPSIVEVGRSRTETSREKVVLVSPIEMLGGDRIWPIARARPDIPFEIRESSIMTDADRAAVARELPEHPNVTVLPFTTDPADIYRRARVLLVPHRVDNRPRVVLEAQTNGIPVLATDFPGLVESIGPGGQVVANDAPPDAWVAALAAIWDDAAHYAELSRAAAEYAQRDEVVPERILDHFETLVTRSVHAHPRIRG